MSKSLFGINDCNMPRKNTKRSYKFNKLSKKTITRRSKPYRYKSIILFPHKLGQSRAGVDKAPAYLKKYINKRRHHILRVKNTNHFFKNINDLYDLNAKLTGKIVNIGGDHSMAIATIADTMNKYPNAKVIYFDAHADLNTYESSKSKHYHGMPLSFITGIDDDRDKHFPFIKNKLPVENLLYIGSRCWDPFERDEIYKRNIKFIVPDDINQHFDQYLTKILEFAGNDPIHISFDVDSIDPSFIPSTGTPVANGLDLNKAKMILDKLNGGNVVKLDITELNMDLGTRADAKKSGINTEKLFSKFLN